MSRIAAAVLSLLLSVATARLLGPDGRGLFFSYVTVAQLIAQLATLGLQSSNVVLFHREPDKGGAIAAGSLVLVMMSAGVASFAVLLLQGTGDLGGRDWYVVIGASIVFAVTSGFIQVATPVLIAQQRVVAVNLVTVIVPLVSLIAAGTAAWLTGSSSGAFAMTSLGAVSGATVLFLLLRARNSAPFSRAGLTLVWSEWPFALRTFVITVVGWLTQRAGVVVLAWVASPAEVGYFSLAVQIGDALMLLPATLGAILFPHLMRHDVDHAQALRNSLRATAIVMALAALGVLSLASTLIPLVFGAAFSAAVPSVMVAMLAVFLLSLITIVSQSLAATGQPFLTAGAWAAGFLVGIPACALLGSRYGAIGAAGSQVAGFLVVLVSLEGLRRRQFRIAHLRRNMRS